MARKSDYFGLSYLVSVILAIIPVTGNKGDYFGLGRLVSIILAIIPITALICGAITRFSEGKILAGILRIVLGWNIIWLIDLILMIVSKHILRIIPI